MDVQPEDSSGYDLEDPKENIEHLRQTLHYLSCWASSQLGKIPYRTLDCKLLRPYYLRVYALMYGADTSRLRPDRLRYMAGKLAAIGRDKDIRKPLDKWSYNDVLRCIEREIERVESIEREDNLHRLDYITRCLHVAVWDGVVVPSREETTQLRAVIHRMREMGDEESSGVAIEIFVLRAPDGGTGKAANSGETQETQESREVLTDDPLNSEELHDFIALLYDMQLWAMKHAKLVSDTAVEDKLIMPYYWRLLGLMKKGDPTKLLPDRLRSWSMGSSSTARELGINKWEDYWTYSDQLLFMEAEFKIVDSREWEDDFYRVDYMTRCLQVAVRDGAVVPTQKESAKLRGAIQRMLDITD